MSPSVQEERDRLLAEAAEEARVLREKAGSRTHQRVLAEVVRV